MKIHLVGGFLGSGKTTAIAGASALLRSNGIPVGVVTNDQGRSLVDTELMRSAGIAAAEVTGGCFCCNFPRLQEMIEELERRAGPSVVFAEPVGSCTDLVATVVKPLIASSPRDREIGRLSVFTDIRLLRQRLFGRPLLFSEDVQYIFDCQIEEAEILVLNKSDLVSAEAAREIAARAKARYREKTILLQSSLQPIHLRRWLDCLEAPGANAGRASIPVDYDRYARGEMVLAWYDASLAIESSTSPGQEIVLRLVNELRAATYGRGRPVGHLKIHVHHAGGSFKASITEDTAAPVGVPAVSGDRLEIMINARAEDSVGMLQSAIRAGMERALSRGDVAWKLFNEETFHPSWPEPSQRMP